MPMTTLAAFEAHLKRHGVDYASWGTGPTKTTDRLFYEYQTGESVLKVERNTLVRYVQRVRLRVFHKPARGKRLYLIEARQRFRNGTERVRSRARSVSEKMVPGESGKGAALRALKEELGFTGIEAQMLVPLNADPKVRAVSKSYPGLLSVHFGPRFKIDLPEKWFSPEGYVEVQPDKTTYFEWIPT